MSDFHEPGAGPRLDRHPVLPSEAQSLPTHVDQCGKRYIALLQYLNLLSRRMRAQRIENWLYRVPLLGLMVWIAIKLWDAAPPLGH